MFDKRRAQAELFAARKQAESDVKVRFAKKSLEVAEAELRRAIDSESRLAQSVSQSELDQLRLVVQRTALEIEQAQLELDLAQTERELKEIDVEIAEHAIRKRKVTAPLAGFVAEVNRHRGEWVQPGQTIMRILRLDRLRAEGLVSAQAVGGDLNGRSARLTVELDEQARRIYRQGGVRQPGDRSGQRPGSGVGRDRQSRLEAAARLARIDGHRGGSAGNLSVRSCRWHWDSNRRPTASWRCGCGPISNCARKALAATAIGPSRIRSRSSTFTCARKNTRS